MAARTSNGSQIDSPLTRCASSNDVSDERGASAGIGFVPATADPDLGAASPGAHRELGDGLEKTDGRQLTMRARLVTLAATPRLGQVGRDETSAALPS
jgi:hypothetical protein